MYMTFLTFLKLLYSIQKLAIRGSMLRFDMFTELRCLANVEMLSVTSCVERRRSNHSSSFVSDKKLNSKNRNKVVVSISNSWLLSTMKIQAYIVYPTVLVCCAK